MLEIDVDELVDQWELDELKEALTAWLLPF